MSLCVLIVAVLFWFVCFVTSDKVMSQISDSLWQIIRWGWWHEKWNHGSSAICLGQTGKPKREDGAMLSTSDVMPIQRQGETASVAEIDDTLHENEPDFQFTRQRSDGQSLCELLVCCNLIMTYIKYLCFFNVILCVLHTSSFLISLNVLFQLYFVYKFQHLPFF